MVQTHAQEVERALDLKRQIAGFDDPGDANFLFKDTSPPSRWETIYSTQTGEPIRVKRHRLIATLEKRLPDGGKAFTADAAAVPAYRLGEVKCFLARGSAEREVIDTLNISPGYYCIAEHLANDMAATVHAEKRHPTRWRMYKDYLDKQERELDRQERRASTEAVLALARQSAGVQVEGASIARGPGRPRKED